ncbi:APP_N domain-containing protein [Trichonephila inaurata madagascariensis]|uniref:APP_N domain-containing protein n=1 Tax=Trichonephila inaurata madagascariensis TaxID=2747483 RepID=A0A8X6J7E8_9ARAC|nr:APP_N domain-containing protein [Trichonephila inaurata madagascariensis]
MKLMIICFFTLFVACAFAVSSREEEDASDNLDSGPNHFQPMVAVLCGHGKLLNKYLDENRRWVTDNDPKAVCTKDKLEILEYCRKGLRDHYFCFFWRLDAGFLG